MKVPVGFSICPYITLLCKCLGVHEKYVYYIVKLKRFHRTNKRTESLEAFFTLHHKGIFFGEKAAISYFWEGTTTSQMNWGIGNLDPNFFPAIQDDAFIVG